MSLKEKFNAAVDVIKSIPYDGTFEPSEEMMLKLYAFEKQATEGPCLVPKPYVWNVAARAQWCAWNELGDMTGDTAMECYIEELTKVVETMSYNDKISKFISLIGPFYEVISQEESQSIAKSPENSAVIDCYKPPTFSEIYHVSRHSQDHNIYSSTDSYSRTLHLLEDASRNYSSCTSSSSSTSSHFEVLSELSENSSKTSERSNSSSFAKSNNHKSCSFLSERDIIMLSILNLQATLDIVLRKIQGLQILTESVNLNSEKSCGGWSLNFAGTAFALVWPFVVELCFSTVRR